MYYEMKYDSPVGRLTLASDGLNLAGLWMEGQKYFGGTVPGELRLNEELEVFSRAKDWLDRYFNGKKPEPSELPLAPVGGEFRQTVWELLCEIPYGELTTYGQIAREAAKRLQRESMSAQAVGGAVGHNPISIIIPCHRVVGTGGSLTGYAGGLDKKIWLLKHEGVKMDGLTVPARGTAL
ncbi:methylated-DNA--[protein]-cysteine S-methyltransferase [Enterocloster lavalensis]|uniref:Methylated-DNA--protein-cysteine methyltransferase n=1 Tax=Enterocloster lavalensis TaxID=460384 RepID=A0A1I0IW35_9FIRM|nr:methylated-DNA--[protein]-cysteine S-methyltransferase [Enterocloster lavalensis]MCB6343208.1 methylated-DNA--[protein]-cysteine S-methyltransferase [Enterocloster lavalensis]SEU01290.1 methylated-DNA-[protein]-cysteine S-methyltransferase [Enterocloster lavalensis]